MTSSRPNNLSQIYVALVGREFGFNPASPSFDGERDRFEMYVDKCGLVTQSLERLVVQDQDKLQVVQTQDKLQVVQTQDKLQVVQTQDS